MTKNWIAVASANHVQRGLAEGFMQVCHGKAGPLRRIKPGDKVVYYSPTAEFGSKIPLRQFTALGIVKQGEPYPFDMGNGFIPHRRDVLWLPAQATPIHPLLNEMEFSAGIPNWAYPLRFGILSISHHDMELISAAMTTEPKMT